MPALPRPIALALGAAVLIGWHLWPFQNTLRDPVHAGIAVVTALAAFFCLRALTETMVAVLPGRAGLLRYALLALLLTGAVLGAISLSLTAAWSPLPSAWQSSSEAAPAALLRATALDVFWAWLALLLTRVLAGPSPETPPRAAAD